MPPHAETVTTQAPVALTHEPALVMGPPARTGVILIEDWGYTGLCARRSMRLLAERLAVAGYPVLRFDLPGMGASLRNPEDIGSLEEAATALDEAAEALSAARACDRFIFAGLGLGALLALDRVARQPQSAAALILMAPPVSGRSWLRENQLNAAMIAERTGVSTPPVPGIAFHVAGIAMTEGLAGAIRSRRMTAQDIPASLPVLVMPRPGRTAEEDFASDLAAMHTKATRLDFSGYDAMVTDPTLSLAPLDDLGGIALWLEHALPAEAPAREPAPAKPAVLTTAFFYEETVMLGRYSQMAGTWCTSFSPPETAGPVVLAFSAGGTPRTGWAHGMRDMARALAARGIASLRVDASDIGDSVATPEGLYPVHYSAPQMQDVTDALDWLSAHGYSQVIATGACSGAYLALRGAVADTRIKAAVCVNLQRLLWDRREDIADLLHFGHDDAAGYAGKLLDPDKLRKLLSGGVPVRRLLKYMAGRVLQKAEEKTAPWAMGLTPSSRLQRQIAADLALVSERGQVIDLIYSPGDPGLPYLERALGPDGAKAASIPGVSVTFLGKADHNLTPPEARAVWLDHLLKAAQPS
ncbi:alpha/beta fold hydrolase [Pannonibacter sp. Pt2-lr]|uniref:Alpha/beta fold hydrolase n=1 Tax=Pannonibacter anstelovis TaxID=3121537 RepID=A0ABU7ZSP5_9HYPH